MGPYKVSDPVKTRIFFFEATQCFFLHFDHSEKFLRKMQRFFFNSNYFHPLYNLVRAKKERLFLPLFYIFKVGVWGESRMGLETCFLFKKPFFGFYGLKLHQIMVLDLNYL